MHVRTNLTCLLPLLLLLFAAQNGTVVDPFAANPAHGALQKTGARVVTPSSLTDSSSSSKQQQQQPVSVLAAASAASMARFSSRRALQDFSVQRLRKTYSKLQVVKLSVNFAEAVQRVQVPMPLPEQLPAGTCMLLCVALCLCRLLLVMLAGAGAGAVYAFSVCGGW
jgi:hypothetical protein